MTVRGIAKRKPLDILMKRWL